MAGWLCSVCPAAGGKSQMRPYTLSPEAAEFFAQGDVVARIAAVRAEFPDVRVVRFVGLNGEACPMFVLERRYACSWGFCGVASTLSVLHRGGLQSDRDDWLDAIREGRALLGDAAQQTPAGGSGGSTREDEQAAGVTSAEEALRTSEPPRPVCACGQTIWGYGPGSPKWCGDCYRSRYTGKHELGNIDARIAAARIEVPYGDVGPWDARDAEYEL
jgi:hypothetical protein